MNIYLIYQPKWNPGPQIIKLFWEKEYYFIGYQYHKDKGSFSGCPGVQLEKENIKSFAKVAFDDDASAILIFETSANDIEMEEINGK